MSSKKKNGKGAKKSLDTPSTSVAASTTDTSSTTSGTPAAMTSNKEQTVIMDNTFTYVRTSKFGNVIYRRGDGRGTLAISKTLFASDDFPREITLPESVTLAAPGANTRTPSPEKLQKLQAAAEKARLRAEKANERAQKALKRAGLPLEGNAAQSETEEVAGV